jgi:hypothetical protein
MNEKRKCKWLVKMWKDFQTHKLNERQIKTNKQIRYHFSTYNIAKNGSLTASSAGEEAEVCTCCWWRKSWNHFFTEDFGNP